MNPASGQRSTLRHPVHPPWCKPGLILKPEQHVTADNVFYARGNRFRAVYAVQRVHSVRETQSATERRAHLNAVSEIVPSDIDLSFTGSEPFSFTTQRVITESRRAWSFVSGINNSFLSL